MLMHWWIRQKVSKMKRRAFSMKSSRQATKKKSFTRTWRKKWTTQLCNIYLYKTLNIEQLRRKLGKKVLFKLEWIAMVKCTLPYITASHDTFLWSSLVKNTCSHNAEYLNLYLRLYPAMAVGKELMNAHNEQYFKWIKLLHTHFLGWITRILFLLSQALPKNTWCTLSNYWITVLQCLTYGCCFKVVLHYLDWFWT